MACRALYVARRSFFIGKHVTKGAAYVLFVAILQKRIADAWRIVRPCTPQADLFIDDEINALLVICIS